MFHFTIFAQTNKFCTNRNTMTEMLSIEALAHYTRGMTTMFFILWTIRIFKYRHHNRMMKVMAVAVG